MTTDFLGLYFRVALRTDVYFLVRTSDELTDKIDGSVIWYTWTNHEIFKILVKRVALFFGRKLEDRQLAGMHQFQMAKILDDVMESRFAGKGHWENVPMFQVLLSLVRNRPRDLVKLCSEAAAHARAAGNNLIRTNDLEFVFENYSQGRLQDTINEYRTELPAIERLLLGMKPTTIEKKASAGSQYSTDALLNKVKKIEEGGRFTFTNGRTAYTKDLAIFMYKINFITARKVASDGEIDRKYFEENRYLLNEFADFGYDWEIHPAYRWALQPNSIDDIFRSLALSKLTS